MLRHHVAILQGLVWMFASSFLVLAPNTARAEVQTRSVEYEYDGKTFIGFLAYDEATEGVRPGILIVHEWWGLNDYVKERARQLAAQGYIALAADMYGDGQTTDHPQTAGQMAGKVRANVQQWRGRAMAALDLLKQQPQCDAKKLAAIGYCFGGSTALQLAYGGADLDAVVSFHGALPTPTKAEVKQIKAQILVCHGAEDSFIPADMVKSFRKALDDGGVKYEFEAYTGARHGFTVPGADQRGLDGLRYNQAADEASWKAMNALFVAAFQ